MLFFVFFWASFFKGNGFIFSRAFDKPKEKVKQAVRPPLYAGVHILISAHLVALSSCLMDRKTHKRSLGVRRERTRATVIELPGQLLSYSSLFLSFSHKQSVACSFFLLLLPPSFFARALTYGNIIRWGCSRNIKNREELDARTHTQLVGVINERLFIMRRVIHCSHLLIGKVRPGSSFFNQ